MLRQNWLSFFLLFRSLRLGYFGGRVGRSLDSRVDLLRNISVVSADDGGGLHRFVRPLVL